MGSQIKPITIIVEKIRHRKERKCVDFGIKLMQIIEKNHNVATYDLESCNLCQIMCSKIFHLKIIPDEATLQNLPECSF